MQYQLPQFIEVEDKIIGPFTFRQFIYLAGGAGLSYIVFALVQNYLGLPFFISAIFPLPIIILALALAFYKVNNRPFIVVLEAAVRFYLGNKLYIWKKETKPITQAKTITDASSVTLPQISGSKLKDLSWNLDIQNTQNPTEKELTLAESAHLYARQGSFAAPEHPVDASSKYTYQHAHNKINTNIHTN